MQETGEVYQRRSPGPRAGGEPLAMEYGAIAQVVKAARAVKVPQCFEVGRRNSTRKQYFAQLRAAGVQII